MQAVYGSSIDGSRRLPIGPFGHPRVRRSLYRCGEWRFIIPAVGYIGVLRIKPSQPTRAVPVLAVDAVRPRESKSEQALTTSAMTGSVVPHVGKEHALGVNQCCN